MEFVGGDLLVFWVCEGQAGFEGVDEGRGDAADGVAEIFYALLF